jgi:NAD(P)H-hydrate epimerase
MKIFSCDHIRQIDAYSIQHEPVASIDLMERASGKIFSWITAKFSRSDHFIVFAGPGNNGGDGLALARMLSERDYRVDTWCIDLSGRTSVDRDINRKRLEDSGYSALNYIKNAENVPAIPEGSIVIDAIFGSGLTRQVEGLAKEIIKMINQSDSIRISVDIPSGLFCENNNGNDPEAIIKADFTITFQFPKISFMFAENYGYCGEWHVLPIGLHPVVIRDLSTPYSLLKNVDVISLIKKRHKLLVDNPPPGTGLTTVTTAVPTPLNCAVGTTVLSCPSLTKIVGNPRPFHCTITPGANPLPCTVREKAAAPA